MYSCISLLMWLRLLYYFRIFKGTGYYIRMIEEVFYGLKYFFFIFLVSVLAFSQANYALVSNQYLKVDENEHTHIISVFETFIMTYRNSISDINIDNVVINESYTYVALYLLLVISTVFVIVVQFNLLIAIVT